MIFAIISICIILAIICVVIVLLMNRNGEEQVTSQLIEGTVQEKGDLWQVDKSGTDLSIQMEMLPAEEIPDEKKLVEITDSKVLARVNALVPGFAQAGHAAGAAIQAAKSGGEALYRVVLPPGAELVKSKDMANAYRGFSRGKDHINHMANLVPEESQQGTAVLANTANAAMSVAAMVVGQYYMTQINTELAHISDGIEKIANFQDNEFRSRVFSLVVHVKEIAAFQTEILENDELRRDKLTQLDSLEEECTKLLGQANLTIVNYAGRTDLKYDEYEAELRDAQNWYMYQNNLLDVLYKISELRYTLYFGTVSREQCAAIIPTYQKQTEEARERLSAWHQDSTERLQVETSQALRKRDGIDRAVHFIPALINKRSGFRRIDRSTADLIDEQSHVQRKQEHDDTDLYAEEVQLISKGGKVYYLPQEASN
ncbi:MAG: hypothetical protein LUE29_04300 [Lachnospiraceae bacterium]|nr:hypothetical protein [Lachnospiraceae bacterium]